MLARPRLTLAALTIAALVVLSPTAFAQSRGATPADPENLEAEVHDDGILLAWDHEYEVERRNMFPDAEDPALFHVYRKGPDGDWRLIATVNARTTEEYFDAGVEAHTTYTYVVTYDDGLESCGDVETCPTEARVTVTSIPFFPTPWALVLGLGGSVAIVALMSRRKRA